MSPYSSRIESESTEIALADKLAEQVAEQAWPGVFSGGKQIIASIASKIGGQDVLRFKFDDGSEMNIVGTFEVRYKTPADVTKEAVGATLQLPLDAG
jgi:hypothetical protein